MRLRVRGCPTSVQRVGLDDNTPRSNPASNPSPEFGNLSIRVPFRPSVRRSHPGHVRHAQATSFGQRETIFRLRDWASHVSVLGTPHPDRLLPKMELCPFQTRISPLILPEMSTHGEGGSPSPPRRNFVNTPVEMRWSARRETDPMDTFVDLLVFYRYCDPQTTKLL